MALLNWTKALFTSPPSADLQRIDFPEFLDSLGDVVLLLDHNLHIVRVNSCWEAITGVNTVNSLNQPFADFLHPEDQQIWDTALQKLALDRSSECIWLRLIGSDSDIRWCEMRIQPVRSNSFYPLSATLCDITPQVRNEQIRNASHRSLESLVNRLPAMLYRSRNNISWTMEYVSQGCEALTGYSAESLLNQTLLSYGSMIHSDDVDYVWSRVQIALQQHQVFELEYRITHKSGDIIKVKEKGKGLYSDSGEVLGLEGIILTLN